MTRRYTILDVFTKRPGGGNPLAVMTEVEGLDDAAMQALAHKIGLSETVFVFPPKNPAHLASIRIFTPAAELPFAGHPTIGSAVCLTQERIWRAKGIEFDALAVLEAKGGILRVAVKPEGEGLGFAEFDSPSLPKETGETAPTDRIAAALGLAPSEIGFENFKRAASASACLIRSFPSADSKPSAVRGWSRSIGRKPSAAAIMPQLIYIAGIRCSIRRLFMRALSSPPWEFRKTLRRGRQQPPLPPSSTFSTVRPRAPITASSNRASKWAARARFFSNSKLPPARSAPSA